MIETPRIVRCQRSVLHFNVNPSKWILLANAAFYICHCSVICNFSSDGVSSWSFIGKICAVTSQRANLNEKYCSLFVKRWLSLTFASELVENVENGLRPCRTIKLAMKCTFIFSLHLTLGFQTEPSSSSIFIWLPFYW